MKRKLFIVVSMLFAFFIFGCSLKPEAEKDVETAGTQPPAMTEVIEPTSTQKPSNEYCNSKDAEKALKRLMDISGIYGSEEKTATQATDNDTTSDELSEADRLLIIATMNEKQLELSLINVPKCLQLAKEHLSNSVDGMIKMFSPEEDVTNEDIMNNLVFISTEQQLFKDEIKRIQECLPSGCTSE